MAFTVNGDHARQEQVFERLSQSYDKAAYTIRRMLTEGAVRASDKRAQFIGVDAYDEAGGTVLRDLFQGDDGGWLQDVGLVEQLVAEKLQRDADTIGAEGWKWIEVAPDFAYGHTYGLRQLRGETVPLTPRRRRRSKRFGRRSTASRRRTAEAEELPDEQRPAHGRDRDRARGARRSPGRLRRRRGRPRRRLRQHRRRRVAADRARLRPSGGRAAGPSRASRRRSRQTSEPASAVADDGGDGAAHGSPPLPSRRRTTACARSPTGC